MIEAFVFGMGFMLFVLFVVAIFVVIFAAAVWFSDIAKEKPKFEPYITEDEQNLFVSRFKSFSFDEMPQFMYGLRNIPPRSIQMQFSHQSRCYIEVTKDLNKKCFKYEVKYKKTVIKTFYDWSDVGDYCWNLNISYRDNPELVIKKLKTEKREALAAGDFE
ncbi:MAG: hypothetical protein J6V44_14125 [Methanobrevibacter sp.]|nr:hypothetical protein [Methanobrevibacter sp.]